MVAEIPSVDDVRRALEALTHAQLDRLAAASGVSRHTLRKVRDGETSNPRLQTVAAFLPHLPRATSDEAGSAG